MYTLLVFSLALSPLTLNAQILYTDIKPDTVVKAPANLVYAQYALDINHDGENDFKFKHFSVSPPSGEVHMYCWPAGNTEAVLCDPDVPKPCALVKGFLITPAISSKRFINTYNDGVNTILYLNLDSDTTEEWDTGEDRYVGVYIKRNGNWHVGWIRLNMPADASEFTVKDYAIQLSPNTPIEAGDMGATTVDNPDDPALQPEIYSTGSVIVVNLPNTASQASLDVYNILGAHIGMFSLTSTSNRVPMHNVVPGIYVAVVRQGGAKTAKVVTVW